MSAAKASTRRSRDCLRTGSWCEMRSRDVTRPGHGTNAQLKVPRPALPTTRIPARSRRKRSPVGWLVTPGVERRLDRVGVEPASGEQGVEAPSPEARIEPGGAPRGLGEDPPGQRQLVQGTTLRFEQLSPAGHILGTDPAAPQLLLEPAPAGRPSAPATRQERPRVLGVVHQPHAPQALQDFLDGPRREALLS